VVLHGGGATGEMINIFPTLTPVAKPRLVHCPTARESCQPSPQVSPQAFAAHLEATFDVWRNLEKSGSIERLDFLTTNTAADANRAAFVAPLTAANALWFCGGDQRHLARFYVDAAKPTLFQQEVLAMLRRGGAVGGSSAGLAIQPDIMIEGGSPENGKPAQATLAHGLGTLKNVLAEQHFDARAGRIERLTSLLRDHARLRKFAPTCRPQEMIGLAIEEDTALIVQANRLRVTGKKLAHVFLQSATARSITWHALKPGDAAQIRFDGNVPELELEDWTAN
jgi:cyanophycinase